MTLKKIGVMSCSKMMGALYGLFGLIFGVIIALLALSGVAAGGDGGPLTGAFFGGGAVVALPVLYGVFGFIGGIITAALYNLTAGLVGGIEVELE